MKDMAKAGFVSRNTETIWNKTFIQVFAINFILNTGQYIMGALIPKYAEYLGATAAVIGLVAGMFAATALCVRPFVGPVTSYYKKNILLSVTIGLVLISFIIYGFSYSITMIIVGRLLHGIGLGFFAPVALAFASDTLPNGKLASGIGIYSLGQAISTAIGPTLGLELVRIFGYNTTFFITSALIGIVFIISMCIKTDGPNRSGELKISLNKIVAAEVIVPAVIMLFLSGAYACISSFIVIYGEACGVEKIGLFFTAYAVCLLFSRPFIGKASDKYGIDKILIPGLIVFALSFIIISYTRSLPMFVLAGAISAFGYGICQPLMQTLCMGLVSSERRSVAGNTNYIGVDVGNLLMPILAGLVVTIVQKSGGSIVLGYAVMFRTMIVPILIALVIYLCKRKKINQRYKEMGMSNAGSDSLTY